METSTINIDWKGKIPTGEQKLVLRHIAAQHLRRGKKGTEVRFAHPLCTGTLTKGGEGTFGTYAGTFFHADLGTVDGHSWTYDFLLVRNSEHTPVPDGSIVLSTTPDESDDTGVEVVDSRAASINDPFDNAIRSEGTGSVN